MVVHQLIARGIHDRRVLAAMAAVPREVFVPPELTSHAYTDRPLPIAAGQTISQPFIVAEGLQALKLRATDRVLEIGAGSGYVTVLLSVLAAEVFAMERHPILADQARTRLKQLNRANATIICGDGTLGLPDEAPFDAISLAAGGRDVPEPLRRQLKIGGRLVMPVGLPRGPQTLTRFTRQGTDDWSREALAEVRFVPLVSDAAPTKP